MTTASLLDQLSKQGVELWFEGARLRFRAPRGALSPEQRAQLVEHRDDVIAALRERAAAEHRLAPLSYGQLSLWFVNQEEPESHAYHVVFAAVIESAVDLGALQHAIQALVDRHAILRTTYEVADGRPSQRVAGAATAVFEVVELPGVDDATLRARIESDYRRPFDLRTGVMRTTLYSRGLTDHVLLINAHHIAVDGWSLFVLLDELRALYAEGAAGTPTGLTRPEFQYTDYVEWQAEMLAGPEGEKLASYWLGKLASPRAEVELPSDRPRPPRKSVRGATCEFLIDAGVTQRLAKLARDRGTTPFVLLLAAYKILLFRYTGTEDIVVGAPMRGRGKSDFIRVLGHFVNPVPLRSQLTAQMSVRELTASLRQTLIEALEGQEYPLPLMVERLQPRRDPSRSPLFETTFVLQRFEQFGELARVPTGRSDQPASDFGGLKARPYQLHQQEGQFDLGLSLMDRDDGTLEGSLTYNVDLFDAATVRQLARHYGQILLAISEQPDARIGDLPLLNDAERLHIVDKLNDTVLDVPQVSVVRRIEQQVASTPDAVALAFEGVAVRYRDLNQRANRIAHYLREAGVGPGVLVGLCLPRSVDLVAAVLAIQKAGGAHVPLDPSFPAERLAYMVADSAAPVVVTAGQATEGVSFPAHVRVVDLDREASAIEAQATGDVVVEWRATDPAYVRYTSGSTGRPKGVVVPQGAYVNFFTSMERAPGLASTDVLAAVTTISFDIAELEMLLPLIVGARIELVSREVASDGYALAQLLERCGATLLQATPATWRMLVDAGWQGGVHIRGITGGEPLPRDLADALLVRLGELWNQYGPTETTVYSTQEPVRAGAEAISIGRPVANTRIYILDPAGEPVPIGVAGEIWIGGVGVATGYHGRPDLTAERFVADRFSTEPGARMYRTGDVGRWLADGRLQHFGRIDHQIKIRGYRIELGEIEAVLATHPAVRQCVVSAREAKTGDLRLVAHVVCHEGQHLPAAEMRRHLQRELPEYMVPTVVVESDSIPLTPSGKVDRRALPNPFASGAVVVDTQDVVAPETQTEQELASIWSDVLRVSQVGRFDDFFALGGHSLLATQLASRIRRAYGFDFQLRRIFEQPQLYQLAQCIDSERRAAGASTQVVIPRLADEIAPPLSFTQERMWILQQLAPESTAYNIPAALRIRGSLDPAALVRAFHLVVQRHDVLRTVYRFVDRSAVQHVRESAELDWASDDLRSHGSAAWDEAIRRADEESQHPFNLERGPVLRVRLWRTAEAEHLLLICVHHIAADFWALGIIARDLAAAYNATRHGASPEWAPVATRYRDFAAWQRQALSRDALAGQMEFWRDRLRGASSIQLPTDRPHPTLYSFRGRTLVVPFPPEAIAQAERLSRTLGSTLFMTLFASFVLLLRKLTNQTDLVVAVPIANRHAVAFEDVVGPLVNTLAMRMDCSDDLTFASLLARVRETALAAFGNQDLPFEHLVEALQLPRDPGRPVLAQVLFNMLNAPTGGPGFEALACEPIPIERHAAQFELSFTIDPSAAAVVIEYSDELFEVSTVRRFAAQFMTVVRTVATGHAGPLTQLSILDADERRQVIETFNATTVDIDPVSVTARIEQQVARTPDAPAVTFEGKAWTYAELNGRVNQIARQLRTEGVGPGVLVGLCVPRSGDLIASVLAILKAGGAYVPLDPGFPPDRLAYMVQDSAAPVLITAGDAIEGVDLPADTRIVHLDHQAATLASQPRENLPAEWRPDDPAYVLYTSGSTGRPKGVVVPQGALVNLLASMQRSPGMSANEVLAAVTTISFDIAAFDIFLPLMVGARVEVVPRETAADGTELARHLSECGATALQATPATWRMLVEAEWAGSPSFRAFTGGEPLSPELADALLSRVGELWNQYGPTETTVYSTSERVTRDGGPISIGRPVENTQVYILDPTREPVPIGVPGELWIGGAGVATGYHHRPELTAERFVPDHFSSASGARMYRTGDLARWLPDGRLHHLGRLDHQVKIRGFRIELGEIESVLAGHESVRQAVVIAREAGPDDIRLVAYIVHHAGQDVTASDVRRFLRRTLPDYMVPSVVMTVDAIPLTPNGKVDRAALPNPFKDAQQAADDRYVAPAPGVEETMAEIWRDVLKVERVGADDNFFELGGHSVLSFRVAAEVKKRTGWRMDPRTLFFQTLRQIAATAATAIGQPHSRA